MSFPYSFKSIIELAGEKIKEKNPDINYITRLLINELNKQKTSDLIFEENLIKMTSKNSIFGFEYETDFKVTGTDKEVNIEYEFHLDKLIKITLLLVVFTAFFSYFNVTAFLIFSALLAIIFYSANLFFINSYLQKIIRKAVGINEFDFEGSEELSKKQKEWMKNPSKCSACGHNITIYDLYCPDCGLRIKQNKFSIPLDTTKYQKKTVKFHYKAKKNKK